jgi:hypothetical protein
MTATIDAGHRRRHAATSHSAGRRVSLTPSRTDLVDGGFVLVLGVVALLEFRTTFAGWNFLIVGVAGLFLGIVLSHLANALRQPAIVLAAMGLAAFFLLGGAVAIRNAPGANFLPTGGTLKGLADGAIHGWRDLLTTIPPVDGRGALLVIPYILGLFGGLGGMALARRTRGALWPVAVLVAVFATVILLGSLTSKSITFISMFFGLLCLAWAAIRQTRLRPVVSSGSDTRTRAAIAAGLLAVTGVGAYVLGPHMLGSGGDRTVLRKYVVPPANVGDYPSPLGEYRQYQGDQKDANGQPNNLKNKDLFTVTGSVPAGTAIRLATLDSYNGIVWRASDAPADADAIAAGKPDTFLKVGPTLDNPAPGRVYTMSVSISNYDDYWMPTAGAVQGVAFTDADSTQQTIDFRYNLATGTGVVPGKLAAKASYTLSVAGVEAPTLKADSVLTGGADSAPGLFLKDAAKALAGDSGNTTAQVLKMAATLKATGRYTHGDEAQALGYYLPGHSEGRLLKFVNGVEKGFPQYVGDDEQYAAAFALMIEQIGVPARVVIGVPALPAGGVVKGSNVAAWVEVRSADGTWLSIPASTFISTVPPNKNQLQQKQQVDPGSNVPPPAQGRPKTSLNDAAQADSSSNDLTKHTGADEGAGGVPGWLVDVGTFGGLPIVALCSIAGLIVGAKVWRRARRRTKGTPDVRLAQGWREVTDHARDLGTTVPLMATRREQANALGDGQVTPLARLADEYVFSGQPLTDQHAHSFWLEVTDARKKLSATVGRWRRLRAAVSLTTFLPKLPGVDS